MYQKGFGFIVVTSIYAIRAVSNFSDGRSLMNNQTDRREELTGEEDIESGITMLRSQKEEVERITRQMVQMNVDAGYVPIKREDLLTTSPTNGHAMKAQSVDIRGVEMYRPGTIIGKASEPLESDTGLIEVFVMLQEGKER
jgi:hypothetical protein